MCVECLDALPSDWIADQRKRAHRIATCPHRKTVELPEFGRPDPEHICTECGVTTMQRQLKDAGGRYLLGPPNHYRRTEENL